MEESSVGFLEDRTKKLEAIHFVNSVFTIFNLRKQGTLLLTKPFQASQN